MTHEEYEKEVNKELLQFKLDNPDASREMLLSCVSLHIHNILEQMEDEISYNYSLSSDVPTMKSLRYTLTDLTRIAETKAEIYRYLGFRAFDDHVDEEDEDLGGAIAYMTKRISELKAMLDRIVGIR